MSFNVDQFREEIVRPALNAIGMLSNSAVNLLLGTCAQESSFGKFLLQRKIGYLGGIGIYQMEKPTYIYTWEKKIASDVSMRAKIRLFLGYEVQPPAVRLASDLALATIMARLYYATQPEPLPEANNIEGLAAYWKKYYNTERGKGTPEQFVINYKHYVKE